MHSAGPNRPAHPSRLSPRAGPEAVARSRTGGHLMGGISSRNGGHLMGQTDVTLGRGAAALVHVAADGDLGAPLALTDAYGAHLGKYRTEYA